MILCCTKRVSCLGLGTRDLNLLFSFFVFEILAFELKKIARKITGLCVHSSTSCVDSTPFPYNTYGVLVSLVMWHKQFQMILRK